MPLSDKGKALASRRVYPAKDSVIAMGGAAGGVPAANAGLTYREWLVGQALSNPTVRVDASRNSAKLVVEFVDAVIETIAEDPGV